MSLYVVLKLLKWIGVLAFTAGVAGAVLPHALADRRRAAHWLATPGIVLMWMGGYGLTREAGISMGSAWVAGAMLLSLVTLQAVVWGVERAERGRALVGGVAVITLLASLVLMVARPGHREASAHAAAPDATHAQVTP